MVGLTAVSLGLGISAVVSGNVGLVIGGLVGAMVGMAGAAIIGGLATPRETGAGNPGLTPSLSRFAFDATPDRWEDLRASVTEILAALSALNEAAGRMAEGAIEQTNAVPRTTQSVEALSDRIDRISQNAEEAADATDRTRQQASLGLTQIQGVIAGMDRLRSQVESNAKKARRLGERSVEIGAIVELISEVSNRTDMLALNATIESVRAGEHGRGFAVVAEEIRKLAERTAGATREIGTLVEAIQADTHESIRCLAEEQAEMEQESRSVKEAGSALERISRMAEDSARLVDGISHSANDQVLAARDLVSGMLRVSDISKLILGETKQLRQEAQSLSMRLQTLQTLVANFKPVEGSTNGQARRLSNRRPESSLRPLSIEATS
ncbi:methyl-accepting chemotaxis protein [Tautonia marina]|uniref:methyl-accepting chemotaxis protein n=1 Tax=Tautonia marina TaxID=2653855 RepID=UPI0013754A11|nr:methyl-accepting chemotaxis protein [Tautonia marina]